MGKIMCGMLLILGPSFCFGLTEEPPRVSDAKPKLTGQAEIMPTLFNLTLGVSSQDDAMEYCTQKDIQFKPDWNPSGLNIVSMKEVIIQELGDVSTNYINLCFYDSRLARIVIGLEGPKSGDFAGYQAVYDKVKAALVKRYGEPKFNESMVDPDWPKEDKGLEILKKGKAKFKALWDSGTVNMSVSLGSMANAMGGIAFVLAYEHRPIWQEYRKALIEERRQKQRGEGKHKLAPQLAPQLNPKR